MNNNYVYVWIRVDLPIEQQIVQAAHSALEAGRELGRPDQISHLILLEAKSETHLQRIADALAEQDIKHHLFYEPDYGRGYTSLTTEPLTSESDRKYFKRHKLYSFNAKSAYGCKDENFNGEYNHE